jgi:hypothetical protein
MSGQFGEVWKAQLDETKSGHGMFLVAVKMVVGNEIERCNLDLVAEVSSTWYGLRRVSRGVGAVPFGVKAELETWFLQHDTRRTYATVLVARFAVLIHGAALHVLPKYC